MQLLEGRACFFTRTEVLRVGDQKIHRVEIIAHVVGQLAQKRVHRFQGDTPRHACCIGARRGRRIAHVDLHVIGG
jgi:hypothetical protein